MFIIIVSFFTILIVYGFYQYVIRPYYQILGYKKKFGKRIEIGFFPVFGLAYRMISSLKRHNDILKEVIREKAKQNPDALGYFTNIGKNVCILLQDPKYIKDFAINKIESYQKYHSQVTFVDLLIEQSIGYSLKQSFKKKRAFLSQFFHFNDVKERIPVFHDCCKDLIKELDQFADGKTLFDIQEISQRATGIMLVQTVLSEQFCKTQINGKPMIDELNWIFAEAFRLNLESKFSYLRNSLWSQFYRDIPTWMMSKREKILLARLQHIRSLIFYEIDKTVEEYKKDKEKMKNKKNKLFFEYYAVSQDQLTAEWQLTRDEMLALCFGNFIAGIDTTSRIFEMGLYIMAKFPEHIDILRKEIDEVIPDYEQMNFDQLSQLKKMENFINETMRFYTPVSLSLPRRALEDNYLCDDLFIPKGTFIFYSILSNFSNPKYFPNPEKFDPDRFNNLQLDPFVFIPFLVGQRNCIAQYQAWIEAKMMFVYVLKKYNFKIKEDFQVIMKYGFLYEAKDNNFLYLTKRQQ